MNQLSASDNNFKQASNEKVITRFSSSSLSNEKKRSVFELSFVIVIKKIHFCLN